MERAHSRDQNRDIYWPTSQIPPPSDNYFSAQTGNYYRNDTVGAGVSYERQYIGASTSRRSLSPSRDYYEESTYSNRGEEENAFQQYKIRKSLKYQRYLERRRNQQPYKKNKVLQRFRGIDQNDGFLEEERDASLSNYIHPSHVKEVMKGRSNNRLAMLSVATYNIGTHDDISVFPKYKESILTKSPPDLVFIQGKLKSRKESNPSDSSTGWYIEQYEDLSFLAFMVNKGSISLENFTAHQPWKIVTAEITLLATGEKFPIIGCVIGNENVPREQDDLETEAAITKLRDILSVLPDWAQPLLFTYAPLQVGWNVQTGDFKEIIGPMKLMGHGLPVEDKLFQLALDHKLRIISTVKNDNVTAATFRIKVDREVDILSKAQRSNILFKDQVPYKFVCSGRSWPYFSNHAFVSCKIAFRC